eukprot:4429094-Prymnesium_polylepis.1
MMLGTHVAHMGMGSVARSQSTHALHKCDKSHAHTTTSKSAAGPIHSGLTAARGGARSGAQTSPGPPPLLRPRRALALAATLGL